MSEDNKKDVKQPLTTIEKEETKKESSLAVPSNVIKELADKYGGEFEYKKESGIKQDGTIYKAQSWIWRSQNKQKEIPVLVQIK